jgi:hypothetical protein
MNLVSVALFVVVDRGSPKAMLSRRQHAWLRTRNRYHSNDTVYHCSGLSRLILQFTLALLFTYVQRVDLNEALFRVQAYLAEDGLCSVHIFAPFTYG